MFVPDKLKLNKFVHVRIPSNKEYFARVGLSSTGLSTQYTGDEIADTGKTKIDSIADMDAYDRLMQSKELENKNDA